MNKSEKCGCGCRKDAEKVYPGAAVDKSDDDKVNVKMVESEVRELNNNPRNNDIDNTPVEQPEKK